LVSIYEGGIYLRTSFRKFDEKDQMKVCRFFERLNCYDSNVYGNLKVMWECIVKYPSYPLFHSEENGIWEDEGDIIGVVRLSGPWFGEVNIDFVPGYEELYFDMLTYAEQRFAGTNREGKRYIRLYTHKSWNNINKKLKNLHYEKCGESKLFIKNVEEQIEKVTLPKGYCVSTLDKVYDFNKLNSLLWYELHYFGEPPAYDDDVYLPIKQAWYDYQRELCTVILDAEGNYIAFCGVWFDEDTKVAYIEPLVRKRECMEVETGKVCIYETIEKMQKLGASRIFVVPNESNVEFYESIGFTKNKNLSLWMKMWSQNDRMNVTV